jgi:phosphoglycerate-specific signal transduction histidine kinase
MPEIYNSNELDGILNIKKRMTKNLKKTFADEEPFGLTVGDAKGLDSLVAATEEIETNAELVVSKLDKEGPRVLISSSEKQINGFYRSVRKGLNIVKNLKFSGLPRSDNEKLSNYLPSLQGYLERFKELFDSRIDVTFDTDEALKNLEALKKQYEQEYNDLKQQELDGDDVTNELKQNDLDYKVRQKDLDNF